MKNRIKKFYNEHKEAIAVGAIAIGAEVITAVVCIKMIDGRGIAAIRSRTDEPLAIRITLKNGTHSYFNHPSLKNK